MRIARLGLAVALLLAAGAQGQPQSVVPPQLEEWRGWALDGHEHVHCPFLYASAAREPGDFVCAWPGRLELEVDAERATFQQLWTIFAAEQWVALPGSERAWPRQVTAATSGGADRRLEVVLRSGAPAVRLPPGQHRLGGVFEWRERPVALAVSGESGVIALTLDGSAIARPRVEDGRLWLGEAETAEAAADTIDVRVFRLVADDVPTRLQTVFAVDVSGGVREETLGPALPAGFLPVAVESVLPALLEVSPAAGDGGDLRVQVRPGQWRIRIDARAPEVLDHVALPTERRNLPDVETWSYRANPRLRDTTAEAPVKADARLVDAPWVDLPTFRVRPGERLAIVERRRGQADAQDAPTLARKLWQDFDGSGFAFADEFGGILRVSSRLQMAAPYQLLAAEEEGESLLVTAQGDSAGVEVTGPQLNLRAHGRIDSGGAMPAAGWQTRLEALTATLNLPPGAKLLAAFGVDEAPTSLAGRWRLLDFFVLLIVTVAAARLFGRKVAAVAFVALLLSYHEPGAPVWTWLNLLAATALARVAPEGRLLRMTRGYRVAALGVLLLFLVPFAVVQIRIAVFPQLETAGHRHAETFGLFETLAGRAPGMRSLRDRLNPHEVISVSSYLRLDPEGQSASPDGVLETEVEESTVTGARIAEDVVFEPTYQLARARPRPPGGDEARQTGPGIPAWEWTSYPLTWSGPVDAGREMRLVILPPWATAVLRFLAVVAVGLFAARFAFEVAGREWRLRLPRRGVPAVFAAAMLLPLAEPAAATTPAPELLEELERRLLRPQPCAPDCAEVAAGEVRVDANALSIRLSVHALARVALPLPGDAGWQPAEVMMDGKAALVARDIKGVLWALVDAGRHTLELRSPPPAEDSVEIPFPAPPRAVEVSAPGWAVAGVEDGVLAAGALHLDRLRGEVAAAGEATVAPAAAGATTRIPPFARVERWIVMAQEWQVYTTVNRVAPAVGPISLRVPLLDGEAIVSGEHPLEDGAVAVAMGPAQEAYFWRSTLPVRAEMTLTAPPDGSWREVWYFDIGQIWRVSFDGLPESQRDDEQSVRQPRFDPRPGETLVVASERPAALPGHTLAFDGAWSETRVGARSRASTLRARYRSTAGASHTMTLPAQATLKTVSIDDERQPLALQDGALTLPLPPGEHTVHVAWDEPVPAGLLVRTPQVGLGAPAGNLDAKLELPSSRWLLFAAGPPVGPAVLYWAELIALVGAAVVLGRLAIAPLRTHHWVLLGVGFSTFSWLAFAVVVLWLLVHGARRKWGGELSRRLYNTTQVGFGLLTLAAFAAILAGIPHGLLGAPDMSVRGYDSGGRELTWFADRTDGALPEASVWSLPMWVYKALILAWALWLSFALLRWLPWVWSCFSEGGLWRPGEAKAKAGEAKGAARAAKSNADDAWGTDSGE